MNGALLDFDGVLVNSEELHRLAFQAAVQTFGGTVDLDAWLKLSGQPTAEISRQLSERYRQNGATTEEVTLARNAFVRHHGSLVRPVAGAEELLAWLEREHFPFAVVTSSSRDEFNGALAQSGLSLRTYKLITADDVTRSKPDPEPYALGAARLGLAAADCVVIEDSNVGVRAALSAGCFLVIAMQVGAHDLAKPGSPQRVVPVGSLHEAIAILESEFAK